MLNHGNAGNISHRLEKLRIFHDLGLNVLLYDYRGYGKSEGAPSEAGLYTDAQAAYDFLVNEKKVPPQQIISYGESLGGSVAAHLTRNNTVGAMILDSSFTSLKDIAQIHYPVLAGLAQSNFDTLSDTANVQVPVLVLHSRNDEIVPFAQGKKLFEAAKGPKQLVELRGDHNGGFVQSKRTYVNAFKRFFSCGSETGR